MQKEFKALATKKATVKEFKEGVDEFKKVLNMYMEQFTKGTICSDIVETCGVTKTVDAWRMLADRGWSQLPEHLHAKLQARQAARPTAHAHPLCRRISGCKRIALQTTTG